MMSGFQIERLYAFVATDPNDGDEGIMGFSTPEGVMMPMIGADVDRVESLKPMADKIKEVTGIEYEIKYFKLEAT